MIVLSKKFKTYVIIIFLSFLTSIYLFEAYLSFFLPMIEIKKKEKIYKSNTGKEFDKRSKLEIFNDLRIQDKKIVISISPDNFVNKRYDIVPLSGISNSRTIHCNENGYYSIFKSDRYGFNNPDSEWDQSEIEYLLVGDSFALGNCVNRPNDIASILRKLTNKPVLTLGYNGNGPLIEYATLKEYLNPKVKKIIWLYFEANDLKNLKFEMTNKILKKYLDNPEFNQDLKNRQNELNILLKKKIINEEKNAKKVKIIGYKIKNFLKLYNFRRNFFSTEIKVVPFEFKKILNLTNKISDQNGAELYFVYLPAYNYPFYEKEDKRYLQIKNTVESLGIPFLDMNKEVFSKEKNPFELFPFKLKGHYNIAGYNKVAEAIFNFTSE